MSLKQNSGDPESKRGKPRAKVRYMGNLRSRRLVRRLLIGWGLPLWSIATVGGLWLYKNHQVVVLEDFASAQLVTCIQKMESEKILRPTHISRPVCLPQELKGPDGKYITIAFRDTLPLDRSVAERGFYRRIEYGEAKNVLVVATAIQSNAFVNAGLWSKTRTSVEANEAVFSAIDQIFSNWGGFFGQLWLLHRNATIHVGTTRLTYHMKAVEKPEPVKPQPNQGRQKPLQNRR